MRRFSTGWMGTAVLVLLIGCVTPPPAGNGNENTNGNGPALTDAQKAAVTSAVAQLENANRVWAIFSGVVSPQLDFGNPQIIGLIPGCPELAWVASANNIALSITFGANGSGCTSPDTGNQAVEGLIGLTVDRSNNLGNLVLNNVTVNAVAVAGSGLLTTTGGGTANVRLTGPVDLTRGNQTINGNITLDLTGDDSIELDAVNLTLAEGATSFELDVVDARIRPLANSSFRPQGGSATFTFGGDTISVTFLNQTPTNGNVQVRINGSAPTTYQLGS
jgi:hypothetical protein